MILELRRNLRPAVVVFLLLSVITGVFYPAAITGFAQVVFPSQANGSFITTTDGRVIGSALVGQTFSDPRYLWSRPSAAGDGYDGMASTGSGLAPTSADLIARIEADIARLREANGDAPIPADLVTASASGLDPHISPAAAAYQVERIASARGVDAEAVRAAIEAHTDQPVLGFLGQPTVNVLLVNLELDGLLAEEG